MPSIPPGIYWPPQPGSAPAAAGAPAGGACARPNLYPFGFMPATGDWQIYVNDAACQFCLWDNVAGPFPGDSSQWAAYGQSYYQGPGGSVTDQGAVYRQMFGAAGWSEFCPSPGGLPSPTISPPPPPAPTSISPGSSCDNPLYIVNCPPARPVTPPPPPTSPPTAPPSPQPAPEGVTEPDIQTACSYASCDDLVGSAAIFGTGALMGAFLPAAVIRGLPLVGEAAGKIWDWVSGVSASMLLPSGCEGQIGAGAAVARAFVHFADRITGALPEAARTLDYVVNCACPSILPTAQDANAAWLANIITDEEWRYWTRANGHCEDQWKKVRDSTRSRLRDMDLLRLWLRGRYSEQQVDEGLSFNGWVYPGERDAFKEFSKELPNPSDLVRFAVRHVFEPSLATQFGFSDELNPNFIDWHSKLGFGYDVPITDPLDGKKYNINWAIAQWWSHWVWPSPTQAVQAGFRFRPDRDRGEEDEDTAALSVDQDTVRLLLRGNDYPPQFRSIIQGLGRPLPGLRQLARAVQTGDVDEAAVREVFKKQGFSDFWSDQMAGAVIQQGADQRLARVKRESGGAIEAAWDVGAVPDSNYLDYLTSLGLPADQAAETLFFAQTKHLVERAKRRLRIFRAGFLKGRWNEEQMRTMLTDEGFVPVRIGEYLTDWSLEITGRTREIARGELKRAACDGILPIAELTQRLLNLKWSDEDIFLTLQEVQLCVAQKEARLLSQQENLLAKSQKAAQQAVAKAAAQLRSAQSALAKHGAPRELAKWYWEGTIPLDEVYARLNFLSWPDNDIERLLNDAMPSESRDLQRQQAAERRHGEPAEIAKWLAAGTISPEEAISRLRFLAWPDPDIARLFAEHGAPVPAGFPP